LLARLAERKPWWFRQEWRVFLIIAGAFFRGHPDACPSDEQVGRLLGWRRRTGRKHIRALVLRGFLVPIADPTVPSGRRLIIPGHPHAAAVLAALGTAEGGEA
jgi:hypothetical protein